MIAFLKSIWAKEPTLVISALVAAIVFVCAKLGIVVNEQSILAALAYVLPILFGGVVTRSKVYPIAAVKVQPPARRSSV